MERGGSDDASIRVATTEDHVAVSRVLDGALLDVADLYERLANDTVLVATANEAVTGAIVLAPEGPERRSAPGDWPDATHVRSIAVRRKRRRNGIGTALLEAALVRWGTLVVDYDTGVDPFYAAVGSGDGTLDVERRAADEDRRWALLRRQ